MADDALAHVGERLKLLRVAGGMTLASLSELTDISVSTLSRLESGLRKPTLELLLPIARVHAVALDDLVVGPRDDDPRVHQVPFHRHGSTFIPLTRHPAGIKAYKQIIPGSPQPAEVRQGTHEGYDWIYVLSGRLHLKLGEHSVLLSAGEVAEFDTRVPHGLASAGPEPVEILNLFSDQGERAHVRASTSRPA